VTRHYSLAHFAATVIHAKRPPHSGFVLVGNLDGGERHNESAWKRRLFG
jgi:hypothetical protein